MRRITDDYREEKYRNNYESDNSENSCNYCLGSGQINGDQCPACDGIGSEPGWDEEDH